MDYSYFRVQVQISTVLHTSGLFDILGVVHPILLLGWGGEGVGRIVSSVCLSCVMYATVLY